MWIAYPEELEASLQAEYGRDVLGEWLTGHISSRKLLALVAGLSPESWFKTQVQDDVKRDKEEAEAAKLAAVKDRNVSELYAKVPKEVS